MSDLSQLQPGERATICEVGGSGALRRRLLDMGVVPGVEVEVVRIAPLGDPVEYMIKGYRLSLRRSEAARVAVEALPCAECPERRHCHKHRRGWRRWLAWLAPRVTPGNGASPAARPGFIAPSDAISERNGHDH
jgi:Fe2+ transport system protein FeoA